MAGNTQKLSETIETVMKMRFQASYPAADTESAPRNQQKVFLLFDLDKLTSSGLFLQNWQDFLHKFDIWRVFQQPI